MAMSVYEGKTASATGWPRIVFLIYKSLNVFVSMNETGIGFTIRQTNSDMLSSDA